MDISVPCFIFSWPIDGPITQINKVMLNHLGYSSSEVVGVMHFENLLTVGSKIFYKTHFYPMLMMNKKIDEMFLSFESKSNQEIPVLMNIEINNDSRPVIHGAGIHIEKRNKYEKAILEAKRVAEKALEENELLEKLKLKLEQNQFLVEQQLQELKRANQEHIEFSKVFAHDLKEPLRKIQYLSNLLEAKKSQMASDPNAVICLKKIGDQSKNAYALLTKLEKYYTLDRRLKDFTTSSISSLVSKAVTALKIAELNPDMSHLEADEVRGDADMLTRLFRELLQNSFQFRNPKCDLTISISSALVTQNYYRHLSNAHRLADFIEIRYKDNGLGFPELSGLRAFELLQKFHPQSGMGLGLAYCKKIIHLHNGRISVKPIVGGGSEFIILLPADQRSL